MNIYHCEHCRTPIDRHAQTRLVTDELGMHFFHVTPDCYEAHKAKIAREAYANAIAIQRDWIDELHTCTEWFKREAPHYGDRLYNGG
jgi:hypothetical protein